MANYTVVDGTHLQLTLNKAHAAQATVAMGGLCGYGLEQKIDTAAGIRQVFPVVGSYSSTGLYYAGGATSVVGVMNKTSAFANLSLAITSAVRNSNTVTVTTAGNLPVDINGLSMTIAGMTDSSYNGSFAVTTIGPNSFTYAQTGANSTSTGGTVSLLTGGYALYPMAEVLSVMNPASKLVDGLMTLAPNTVAWSANDTSKSRTTTSRRSAPILSTSGRRRRAPPCFSRPACSTRATTDRAYRAGRLRTRRLPAITSATEARMPRPTWRIRLRACGCAR